MLIGAVYLVGSSVNRDVHLCPHLSTAVAIIETNNEGVKNASNNGRISAGKVKISSYQSVR